MVRYLRQKARQSKIRLGLRRCWSGLSDVADCCGRMKVLVLICVVAVAVGQPAPPPRDGGRGPPPDGRGPPPSGKGPDMGMGDWDVKPCCFPDKWAGKQYITTSVKDHRGNHDESKSVANFHVDFAAGKLQQEEVVYKDMKVIANVSFVADFHQQYAKRYCYKSKACTWYQLPKPPLNQCITKKAKFTGSSMIGMGDAAIKVNHFMAESGEEGHLMHMKIGVTADHCVPVYSQIHGELAGGKLEFKRDTMYFDNKDNFTDDGRFDYEKQLSMCTGWEEVDTPDMIKGLIHIQEQFFPMTAPRKCCFPMAFEGQASHINGTNQNGQASLTSIYAPHFAISYKYLKFAATKMVSIDGQSTQNLTFIGDMRYGSMYTVDVQTKECKKYNIPTVSKMGGQCVPAAAHHMGMPTLGLVDGGLDASVWHIDAGTKQVEMTVTHNHGSCVPVSELSHGELNNGGTFLAVSAFFDLKEGIENFEVFDPPETCNGVPAEVMPTEIEALIGGMIENLSRE